MMALQMIHNHIQISPRHAQQKAAARLRIRQQRFLSGAGAVPFSEFGREGKIVVASARDAAGCNEMENLRVDHGHGAGGNLSANTAGATHRAEMPEQSKPSHINRSFEKAFLSEARPFIIELCYYGDGSPFRRAASESALDPCRDDTCA
jgi:hypothetical protein